MIFFLFFDIFFFFSSSDRPCSRGQRICVTLDRKVKEQKGEVGYKSCSSEMKYWGGCEGLMKIMCHGGHRSLTDKGRLPPPTHSTRLLLFCLFFFFSPFLSPVRVAAKLSFRLTQIVPFFLSNLFFCQQHVSFAPCRRNYL